MLRGLVAAVVLAGLMAECERRVPEEFVHPAPSLPAPAASAATPTLDHAPARAGEVPSADPGPAPSSKAPLPGQGRCILATPDAPPPPVPAGPAAGCPPDPEPSLPALPLVHVGFPDAAGAAVDAEVVRSEHDTSRGLMYRKRMPEGRGMLFDLRVRQDHKFWMHNTCIPLDLIYVDTDGLVVGIVENAPTLDDESRGVGCLSQWVLEVNAGWARRHGVKAGQHMSVPSEGMP